MAVLLLKMCTGSAVPTVVFWWSFLGRGFQLVFLVEGWVGKGVVLVGIFGFGRGGRAG